ncbi:hypothetical protein ACFLRM_04240 [Acidobacteriota bacterium]
MGKECVWINYWYGAHGLGASRDEELYRDKWERVIDWYKTYFEKNGEKDKERE